MSERKKNKTKRKTKIEPKPQLIVEFESSLSAEQIESGDHSEDSDDYCHVRLIIEEDDNYDPDTAPNSYTFSYETLKINRLAEPVWIEQDINGAEEGAETTSFEVLLMETILRLVKKGKYAEK